MLRRNVNRSINYILPSPIGGLNMRDSIDAMEDTDAILMDNYYPSESSVCLRNGYKAYALQDADTSIETLIKFCNPQHSRLFAATAGKIIDVTSGSDDVMVDELDCNVWQYVQFRDRLLLANGVDNPLSYYENGQGVFVWEDTVLSGTELVKKHLCKPTISKQRVFYVEKNSLCYWYADGVGEVQGTLNKVDLSFLTTKGGYLAAIASWTLDGGQGIDDLTVFITSEGEVLVYSGSNPSDPDDWKMRGKYFVSRPIGDNCVLQYQGDIVLICEEGYLPLSAVLKLAGSNVNSVAYSDKIRGLFLSRVKNGKNLFGWQGIIYPRGGYALFNVPIGAQFEQHVINMSSGAWCRFVGINSLCWCLFEGRLFFGSESGVYLFDEGQSDDGMPIAGSVHQAYCALGSASFKKILMLNPRIKSNTSFALNIYTNMDFDDQDKEYAENIGSASGSRWNFSKWSCLAQPIGTKWGSLKTKIQSQWIGNNALGFKASVVFRTKTSGTAIEWYNTGLRFEQGEGLG